jgi:hypothetical protein
MGAVAGLVVIAACTDYGDKSVTGPPAGPRNSSASSGQEGSNNPLSMAGRVKLCVDPSSPVGDYTFVYSHLNDQAGLQGNELEDGGFWTDLGGDWMTSTPPAPTNLNDGSTTVFNPTQAGGTIHNNGVVGTPDCVLALQRTVGSQEFRDNLAAGKTAIDTWSGMTITSTTNNAGATYNHTDCILDLGVIVPQRLYNPLPAAWNSATNYAIGNYVMTGPAGNRQQWRALVANTNVPPTEGATWSNKFLSDCGTSNNPTRAFANFEHGTVVIFAFTAPTTLPCPAGTFTWSVDGGGNLQIVYDQFPAPNDNSYGDNSIGWKPNRPHRFKDLTNSDHAGIQIRNASNNVVLSFLVDYLTASASAPSGYASLGVTGGDGGMLTGTATGITATTSLAKNLNNINIPGLFNPATHAQLKGSVNVLEDSPPTNAAHTLYSPITDPLLTGWDFHNTYFVTISAAKLASIGFNSATWKVQPNAAALHNSPDKACPST